MNKKYFTATVIFAAFIAYSSIAQAQIKSESNRFRAPDIGYITLMEQTNPFIGLQEIAARGVVVSPPNKYNYWFNSSGTFFIYPFPGGYQLALQQANAMIHDTACRNDLFTAYVTIKKVHVSGLDTYTLTCPGT